MSKNLKINGVIYNDVQEVEIPLATDTNTMIKFVNTSDADAAAKDIIKGKSAYVDGEKVTGSHTDPTFSLTDGVLTIA